MVVVVVGGEGLGGDPALVGAVAATFKDAMSVVMESTFAFVGGAGVRASEFSRLSYSGSGARSCPMPPFRNRENILGRCEARRRV